MNATGSKYLDRNIAEFGTVEFEGRTYVLRGQAERSNRVFPGWRGDAEENETYTDEFECLADTLDLDDDNEYRVRWHFTQTKGEELEDDGRLPGGNVHSIEII